MDTLLDTLDSNVEASGANFSVKRPSRHLARHAPGADRLARYRAAGIKFSWVKGGAEPF